MMYFVNYYQNLGEHTKVALKCLTIFVIFLVASAIQSHELTTY